MSLSATAFKIQPFSIYLNPALDPSRLKAIPSGIAAEHTAYIADKLTHEQMLELGQNPRVGISSLFGVPDTKSVTLGTSLAEEQRQIGLVRPENPLLDLEGLPRWNEIKAEHIVPAIKEIEKYTRQELARLEAYYATLTDPDWNSVYHSWNALNQPLRRAWVMVSQLKDTMKSEALDAAYDEALKIVVDLDLLLGQSQGVFHAFQKLKFNDASKQSLSAKWFELSETERRIVDSVLLGARLKGIELQGDAKKRFGELYQDISALETKFRQNDTNSKSEIGWKITDKNDVVGLASFDLELMAESYAVYHNKKHPEAPIKADPQNGPWRVDKVSYIAFLTRAENREWREKIWRAFQATGSTGTTDNTPLIPEVLRKRSELARLLGFETYADLSLATKMAGKVSNAQKLLDDLWSASAEGAKKEYAELVEFAKSKGFQGELKWWDYAYYTDKLQQERYSYDEATVKKYFNLDRALDALFMAAKKSYGITVKAADGSAPTYHPDQRFFKVYDRDGKQIASFFYDPYKRSGQKRDGAWMEELIRRRVLPDGTIQLPVTTLVTNFDPPAGGKPAKVSIGDMETLFHEFGHALQQILTEVNYDDASGTNNVEWDAVEVASQLNEYWLYQKDVLKAISSHEDTGEPISDVLIDKILGAKTFMGATMMMRQLIMAKTDLELHSNYNPDTATESVYEVYNRFAAGSGRPVYSEGRFLNSFNHIFGGSSYAAGYFSYKWAEVLAADYFSAFKGKLDDPQAIAIIGARLRDTLYAQGGGRHPNDVFRDFMGREYSVDPLLEDYGLN